MFSVDNGSIAATFLEVMMKIDRLIYNKTKAVRVIDLKEQLVSFSFLIMSFFNPPLPHAATVQSLDENAFIKLSSQLRFKNKIKLKKKKIIHIE